MLVPERFTRNSAALLDPIGQLKHLINGLLAVQPHDVVVTKLPPASLRVAGHFRQHLDKHRDHDLGPALAYQRKRAVKIKQDMANLWPRPESSYEFHQPGELVGR